MAKISRPAQNVEPFAIDSTSTNRTVFGDVTQSDAMDDNLNTDFKTGWEIVASGDNPSIQDFNAMGYTLGLLISYLFQMGIPEWDDEQEYHTGSRCQYSGVVYRSLTDTNVNHNPSTDGTNWEKELTASDIDFSGSGITATNVNAAILEVLSDLTTHAALTMAHGSTSANTASRIVQRDAAGVINITGGTSPSNAVSYSQVSAAITAIAAATASAVNSTLMIRNSSAQCSVGDATSQTHAVALGQFSITRVDANNGYMFFPGVAGSRFCIQWFEVTGSEDVWANRSFPTTFPNRSLCVVGSGSAGVLLSDTDVQLDIVDLDSSGGSSSVFRVVNNAYGSGTIRGIAIGF